ncbi:DMT family transporter [Hansschlegelia plantiphila]|uniref:EamA domain-containing protein n=1 Tax=Hansschlegelia plantiphila TaxID=374655 RepID=A0A9W6J2P7_9HYPH|nr:DMT family transporter [Hansschlegelia plantiphila]GLK69736.1 hypothetical protein GCM10008179_33740 [Hansschlegelia plantiphila]
MTPSERQDSAGGSLTPSLAVAFSTIFWGAAWLPMRMLKERGLDSDWAIALIFGVVALALSPVVHRSRARLSGQWRSLALIGATGGVAMTCYYLSVGLTTIARATLLFYLAPIWTTLIEYVGLRRPIGGSRAVEIGLGLLGLGVILGFGSGGGPANAGDALALLAGVTFALSSYFIYRAPEPGAAAFTWCWAIGSAVSAAAAGAALNPDGLGRALAAPAAAASIFAPIMLLALVMFMPMNLLTLWGASRLTPTRVALLLMGEVAVAFLSAALLSDDPFGARELIGCALILAASLVEPLRPRRVRPVGQE